MESLKHKQDELASICQARVSGCAAVEKMRSRPEGLKECFRVSGLIISSLQLDQVLENIMTTSRSILKADACSLILVDGKSGDLVFEVAQGPVADKLKGRRAHKQGAGNSRQCPCNR